MYLSGKGSRTSQRLSLLLVTTMILQLLSFVVYDHSASAESAPSITIQRTDGKNLVFPVVSDIHIGHAPKDVSKWQMVLNQLKEIAPNYDAIAAVGDITDWGAVSQYDTLMSHFNNLKVPTATPLFAIGNHDYLDGTANAMQTRFKDKTGMKGIYYDQWINGYHFIVLGSEDGTRDGTISDQQINWLNTVLAQNADVNKPIFVFLHQPITNTVYGSDLWGHKQNATKLYNTLAQYPQVITFSGHSHYVLDDPASIHQRDFTAVGTSAVRYPELEPGKIQGIHPSDEITQGLVVEVYDDEVIIKRRDFHTNAWTGEEWTVKYPASKNQFTYTDNRDIVPPVFPSAAKATIDPASITPKQMRVTFDQATDNLFVRAYEIKAINTLTGVADQTFQAFAQMYDDPVPSNLSFDIGGLQPETPYRVEVSAMDSFNNRSVTPLTAAATTAPKPDLVKPVADIIDIDFADGTAKDHSPSQNDAYSTGSNATIVYSSEFNKYVARMNGTTDHYFAIPSSSSIKNVTREFTLESVFRLREVDNQAVVGNTQSGGLSFESTSAGTMELWAHIGGSYKRVGTPLAANTNYHLVATYDGSKVVIYVNGEAVKTITASGLVSQPDIQFAIGADPEPNNRGNYVFNGDVSIARLYSTAIYPEQVKMLYDEVISRMAVEEFDELYAEIQTAKQLIDDVHARNTEGKPSLSDAYAWLQAKIVAAEQVMSSLASTRTEVQSALQQLAEAAVTLRSNP